MEINEFWKIILRRNGETLGKGSTELEAWIDATGFKGSALQFETLHTKQKSLLPHVKVLMVREYVRAAYDISSSDPIFDTRNESVSAN